MLTSNQDKLLVLESVQQTRMIAIEWGALIGERSKATQTGVTIVNLIGAVGDEEVFSDTSQLIENTRDVASGPVLNHVLENHCVNWHRPWCGEDVMLCKVDVVTCIGGVMTSNQRGHYVNTRIIKTRPIEQFRKLPITTSHVEHRLHVERMKCGHQSRAVFRGVFDRRSKT